VVQAAARDAATSAATIFILIEISPSPVKKHEIQIRDSMPPLCP
jgi:hypothetical protein